MNKHTPTWRQIQTPLWAALRGLGEGDSKIERLLSGERFSVWWFRKFYLPHETMLRYVRRHRPLCADAMDLIVALERRHGIRLKRHIEIPLGVGFMTVVSGKISYLGGGFGRPHALAKMAAGGREEKLRGPIRKRRLDAMDRKLREASILSTELNEVIKWQS